MSFSVNFVLTLQVAVCNLASIALNMFVRVDEQNAFSGKTKIWYDFEMLKKVTKVCVTLMTVKVFLCWC